jgi:hypothetical protein
MSLKNNKTTEEPAKPKFGVAFVGSFEEFPHSRKVYKELSEDPSCNLIQMGRLEDVAGLYSSGFSGVVILSITRKSLVTALTELPKLGGLQKNNKTIRYVALDNISNQKLQSFLKKELSCDILMPGTASKSTLYIITQHIKMINEYVKVKGESEVLASKNNILFNHKPKHFFNKNKTTIPTVEIVAPLNTDYDFWYIDENTCPKFLVESWVLELIGPAPSAGSWEEASYPLESNSSKAKCWFWRPRNLKGDFASDEGFWLFNGKKPEFVWKKGHWRFIGKNVSLSFFQGKNKLVDRFIVDKIYNLNIRNNSINEKLMLAKIKYSLEVSFVMAKNSEFKQELDIDQSYRSVDKVDLVETNYEDPDVIIWEGMNDVKVGWGQAYSKFKEDKKNSRVVVLNKKLESPSNQKIVNQVDSDKGFGSVTSIRNKDLTGIGKITIEDESSSNDGKVTLKQEDLEYFWATGSNAFKATGTTFTWSGEVLELLELDDNLVIVDFPINAKNKIEVLDFIKIDVLSLNLKISAKHVLSCKVLEINPHESSKRLKLKLFLDKRSAESLKELNKSLDKRQQEIYSFFKLAKG